ncbi:MAG: Phosphoribosylformylglycinamidine cyclo-ligase [Syntrophomonadaceae bacterium]|nr:Phosphoribosylformylglycinamidine cyclo-ligase [Bacillota bacterium]
MRYKEAGVDIDSGDRFVEKIKSLVRRASRPEVLGGIGAFSGLFQIDVRKYRCPVLVAGADGVGTKSRIAAILDKWNTIGIDLVAMSVNDILAQGAEPLFFLDYLSMGKLDSSRAEKVIKGIVEGCELAGCALLGGETAEMPGFYPEGECELAGFAVGVVEKDRIIDGSKIKVGDKIIGIAGNGLHSNGYSMVRKVFGIDEGSSRARTILGSFIGDLGCSLGEELLKPTKIYVKSMLTVLERFKVNGIAHITGGGMKGNIPRILSDGCKAIVHRNRWQISPIFEIVQRKGNVPDDEMFKVFNMGIGMALVVSSEEAEEIKSELVKKGEGASIIGEIVSGKKEIEII